MAGQRLFTPSASPVAERLAGLGPLLPAVLHGHCCVVGTGTGHEAEAGAGLMLPEHEVEAAVVHLRLFHLGEKVTSMMRNTPIGIARGQQGVVVVVVVAAAAASWTGSLALGLALELLLLSLA